MPLRDGQVHHDTHVIPRGNYVIGVGNYLLATPSELGNCKIVDIQPLKGDAAAEQPQVLGSDVIRHGGQALGHGPGSRRG